MKVEPSNQNGIALIECLVAIVLTAIAVGILAHSQQTALRYAKYSELEILKNQTSKSAVAQYLAKQLAAEQREVFSIPNSSILGSVKCDPLLQPSAEALAKCEVTFSDKPGQSEYFVQ